MMNNRHNSIDSSYVPSIMSFVGLEGSTPKQQHHHRHLWDYEAAAAAAANAENTITIAAAAAAAHQSYPFLTNTQFLDNYQPPPLLPMNNFSFYSVPPPLPSYHGEDLIGSSAEGRIGLNLGQRTYFSSGDALALGRLWGRGRGVYAFGHHQPPRCQVEGCGADLSAAKHYHRRHKVCEFHSKSPVVMLAGGIQQRFCQQCSRFHILSEFDEAKKNCRERLADHNWRRRRKPKPLSPAATSPSSSKNPSATPANKEWKPTPKPSNIKLNKATTKSSLEVLQQGGQNSGTHLRNNPALSLGGVGAGKEMILGSSSSHYNQEEEPYSNVSISKEMSSAPPPQQQHHHQLHHHYSNGLFHHQNLFSSSSNEASQSMGGTSGLAHQHRSSILQLGQAPFELDFL